MVDFNDSVPRYDFTMDLRRADLARLHVNRRDSVSELSAHIVAKAGGRSLDDLNGRIQVTDVLYRYNDKQLTSKSMTVTGENSARSKLVELRSDFADATFRSKTSYREVFRYLRASAWKYLPLLRHGDEESGPRASGMAVANDFSLLSVDVRHIDPIADAISPACRWPTARRCNCFSTPRATSFRSRRLRNISNASVCWPRGSTSTLRTGATRSRSTLRPKTSMRVCSTCRGFRSRAAPSRGACSSRQASTIRCARYPDWWASGPTSSTSTGPTAASSTCASCRRTSPAARRPGRFSPTRYSLTRRRS